MHPAPVRFAHILHVVLLLLILAALASAQENTVRPLIVQAVDTRNRPLSRAIHTRWRAPNSIAVRLRLICPCDACC
jgi:hypothetical protein